MCWYYINTLKIKYLRNNVKLFINKRHMICTVTTYLSKTHSNSRLFFKAKSTLFINSLERKPILLPIRSLEIVLIWFN